MSDDAGDAARGERTRELPLISRALKWLFGYSVCCSNLGFLDAAKVLLLGRLSKRVRSVTIPDLPGRFHFRGKADLGVMSHFFTQSYYIRDTEHRRIHSIVDCGANIGDETVKFWLWYADATIVALEPESHNFALLDWNTAKLSRVVAKRSAVWPRRASLNVVGHQNPEAVTVQNAVWSDASTQELVEGITIPEIMANQGWSSIDILKIDIEGSEVDVLRESSDWIHKVNVIIIETNDSDRSGATAALFAAVSIDAFDAFVHGENHVLIRRGLGWTLAPRYRLGRVE